VHSLIAQKKRIIKLYQNNILVTLETELPNILS